LFNHTGDGVCAAFGSARGAIDAAVAAPTAEETPGEQIWIAFGVMGQTQERLYDVGCSQQP
jgi:hypothetical protein